MVKKNTQLELPPDVDSSHPVSLDAEVPPVAFDEPEIEAPAAEEAPAPAAFDEPEIEAPAAEEAPAPAAEEFDPQYLPQVEIGDQVFVTRELTSPYHWIPLRVLTGLAHIDRFKIDHRGQRIAVLVRVDGRPGEHEWDVSEMDARTFRAVFLRDNPPQASRE